MEKDEEIALFFELKRREADDYNLPALRNSEDLDGSNPGLSSVSKIVPLVHSSLMGTDDSLKLENYATDYDWLLTPPDIPLFPLLEMETQKPTFREIEKASLQTACFSTKPADTLEDRLSDATFGLVASAPELIPSKAGNKDQSATRKPASIKGRPATDKTSRSSTPSLRATLPSTTKLKNPPTRSSTPNRSGSRSSTPTARARPAASVTSKSSSRSSTPTHIAVTSSSGPSVSGPSCAGTKSAPLKSKNPTLLRNKVPIVKSSPGQPAVALGVLVKAPPSSLTALPERPASALRGRLGVSTPKTVSATASVNGKPTQKSCSPSIVLTANSSPVNNRNFNAAWNRAHSNGTDYINPVVIGTQMVERLVNMRKLAPPMPDRSCGLSTSAKSASSRDGSGFGLSLSKKSLDMAIRHMSITAGAYGKLKPLNTKMAKASGNSTSTESTKSSSTNLSESPVATSSDASSDPTIHFNSNYVDGDQVADSATDSRKPEYCHNKQTMATATEWKAPQYQQRGKLRNPAA